MEQRWFENIRKGLNVCDRDGDKIGTVGSIYRRPAGTPGSVGGGMSTGNAGPGGTGTWGSGTPERGTSGSGSWGSGSTESGGKSPSSMNVSGHLKVDTGFLGLGKDLYIPFDAIREATSDCVYLNVDKDDISRTNWDVKPDYISGIERM